ncbi:MAG: class I SAM-dependent methyltransferase [Acidobacteriota bacterium]|nr:class I SAM-dependent methyltransferase [Acidobacteriota bacterium]
MSEEGRQDAAAQFWDRESVSPTHVSWMAHPSVRDYINASIGGSPHIWPMDWFVQFLGQRRFSRALSIGCGTGPLERDLIRRGICQHVDAFDGSPGSIDIARNLAAEEGAGDRIHYYVDDFNEPKLPRNGYDIVFFHQSLHHVAKLEKLMAAILRTLRGGGLLYIDEYIGPSRFDWNDALIAPHRALFAQMPAELRLYDPLPLPIHPVDPSEAIRSSEIMPQLARGFRLLARRDYGGTILSVLFPMIDWSRAPESLVGELVAAEKQALANGLQPYHAIAVSTPKRAPMRWLARIGYFVTPKLRRIRWEVRKRLRPNEEVTF